MILSARGLAAAMQIRFSMKVIPAPGYFFLLSLNINWAIAQGRNAHFFKCSKQIHEHPLIKQKFTCYHLSKLGILIKNLQKID
jgi:hypothetical protein